MSTFTPEAFGFTFLEEGSSVQDFIEQKINRSSSLDSKNAFFVADLGEIVRKYLGWVRAMPRITPFYAVKCNECRPIVKMLATLGTGFECTSEYEINLVQSLGVESSRIIYSNTCKQVSHLKYAAAHGVEMMTFDSEAELVKFVHCHKNAKLVLRIATDDSNSLLKFNNKFGATLEASQFLLERAWEMGLDVIGVNFHVGSACINPEAYTMAIADARNVFDMGAKLGYKMTLLDIGGGFPGYDIEDKFVFKEFVPVINSALEKYFPDPGVRVISEPGRYFPASAFTLAVNIIDKKNDVANNSTRMYYVNEGIHSSFKYVLSPYANVLPSPHKKLKSDERTYPSTIFGQTCDGHDILLEEFHVVDLQVGEWLLFYNMGAYTITTSTNFSGFPKPDIHYVMSQKMWQRISAGQDLLLSAPVEEACPSDVPEDYSYVKPCPARKLYAE